MKLINIFDAAYTAAGYQAAGHIQPATITSMATGLSAQQQQIIPQQATMLNPAAYQNLAGYSPANLQQFQPQFAAAAHLAAQPIQQAAANFNN